MLTDKAKKNFKKLFDTEAKPHLEDPELYEILQNEIFGEVFSTEGIDIKKRELFTIIALTCLQTLPQLKAHVQAALNVGNTALEIRETIYLCSVYIGYPIYL